MDLLPLQISFSPLFLASGLNYAITNLGTFSLLIIFLLIVSFCWGLALILSKNSMITEEERKLEDFREQLDRTSNPLAVFSNRNPPDGSLADYQYRVGCRELCAHLLSTAEPDEHFSHRLRHAGKIAPSQIKLVHQAMERAIAEGQMRLEQNQFLLQAGVLAAPSLGLMGTLVTFINHFGSAGRDLNAPASATAYLAPAFLTALAGLLVGTVFYLASRYLQGRQQRLCAELKLFSRELVSSFERLYLDHHVAREEVAAGQSSEEVVPVSHGSAPHAPEDDLSVSIAPISSKSVPVVFSTIQEERQKDSSTKENLESIPPPEPDFILHETEEGKSWRHEADLMPFFQEISKETIAKNREADIEATIPDSRPTPARITESANYFAGETEAATELGNKLRRLRQQALLKAAHAHEASENSEQEAAKPQEQLIVP